MNKDIYVYDIETYPNIFTFVFRKVSRAKDHLIFEISSRRDNRKELISFLGGNIVLVGFNNLFFDYPVIHYLMGHPKASLEDLYREVEQIIASERARVPFWNIKIEQVDLYKIWHYDNAMRRTSLKWLEFTLRWHKVQDLPYSPGTIIPENEFDKLIKYNINDVDFTYFFLGRTTDAINFRYQMTSLLNHNVMNYSDVKIGEYINRLTYSKNSGREFHEYRDQKTYRKVFLVKDLIPEWVAFDTPYMSDFLSDLRGLSIRDDDKKFELNPVIGDLVMNFKKGGLHSQDSAQVITCEEGYYLKEADVGSMYPKSIIEGNLYPEHLGTSWRLGIQQLYEERVHELKPALRELEYDSEEWKFINSKQAAYKLAMNGGGYGKTGSSYSWQYDPLVMMKTTFRGQLALLMLLEKFHLAGFELISANTDGVVIHYPKDKHTIVEQIKRDWEKVTKYELEDTYYSRIVFRDVNNYLAEIIDKESGNTLKVKHKGVFDVDPEYHKNNSQRVVAIALHEYFVNDIPVEDVINNIGYNYRSGQFTNIFDYCIARKKVDKVASYTIVDPDGNKENVDKVIRFYVSTNGRKMFKVYASGKTEAVVKGFLVTPFMEYKKEDDYNINYDYYIRECRKVIKEVEMGTKAVPLGEQLKLF